MDTSPTSLPNPLAARLRAGELAIGMIVKQTRSVDIALAAHSCGYDAITVDLEHSSISEADAAQICIAALSVGVAPLVRVPSHDPYYAARVLDAGAIGVVAPHVENAEQARRIVHACRFAPRGERSVAGQWPQLGYRSYPARQARALIEEQTTVIVMLESPAAIENAAEIAAVDGVDILHIGTTDLCDGYGAPGQFDDPRIEAAYIHVVAACRANGKHVGAGGLGQAPEIMKHVLRLGARFVTAGNDWAYLMQSARQRASSLRELPLA